MGLAAICLVRTARWRISRIASRPVRKEASERAFPTAWRAGYVCNHSSASCPKVGTVGATLGGDVALMITGPPSASRAAILTAASSAASFPGYAWADYVAGDRDLVVAFRGMDQLPPNLKMFVPNLRKTLMLPGCGHWTPQERPTEVNAAMLEFVKGL